eukprot:6177274-Pyramimonas_sp.AAC.1
MSLALSVGCTEMKTPPADLFSNKGPTPQEPSTSEQSSGGPSEGPWLLECRSYSISSISL